MDGLDPFKSSSFRNRLNSGLLDARTLVVNMAAATGQSEDQVEADLSDRRAFEAEDAQGYGLVERVVQSRREVF